jgi:predicted RNA-binding Zn-ribbon protein involved in translation (DUF1610 family)
MPNHRISDDILKIHMNNMNLSFVSTYRNLGKKTSVICNTCGFQRNVFTSAINQENCKCPKCAQYTRKHNTKRTEADYKRDFEKKNEDFTFVRITEEGYLECICDSCGVTNIFRDKKYTLRNEISCSNCGMSESWNERYATRVFENQNIWFEKQKKFKDLGVKRFDFYFPFINACLEIQGEQHYEPVKFRSDESEFKHFERTKLSDITKRMYCENHGIKLFIIDARNREKFKNRIWNFVYTTKLGLN